VVEPYDTFGSDDSLPSLAWAALKTGFRFAVAWTSESATTEQLSYSVGGGAETAVSETVPTRVHLFVLDGLPEGKTLCFRPGGPDGPLHAVRLANAMEAYAEGVPHGVYTANYLVLVNEMGDRAEVEAGVADYANRLWDATDGWVRAGAVLIIATDAMHHNSGWSTCYLLSVDSPACNRLFDVIFTEDAVPQGAASTYRQGVRDPDAAIWMNMHWQAVPGPVSLDAAGAVLTHETGHYLFDMDDLYGDPVVPDAQDCTDTSFDMSIMGGDRDVTEFDDEFARCSTQGSGYVPSWTLFRRQFPEVWDRPAGPDPGPSGNGGVFLQRTYLGP